MENLLRRLDFGLFTRHGKTARAQHPTLPVPEPRPAMSSGALQSQLAERRIAALRNMFPSLFSWCANRAQLAWARNVHDYLAQATNLTDLEQRIRAVEQQKHFS